MEEEVILEKKTIYDEVSQLVHSLEIFR